MDAMLPCKEGLSACKEIRQISEIPIITVTARVEEIDRLPVLYLGADDHICKPFCQREFMARTRAVLRHSSEVTGKQVLDREEESGSEFFACSLCCIASGRTVYIVILLQ